MVLKVSQINDQYIYVHVGFSEAEINDLLKNTTFKITDFASYRALYAAEKNLAAIEVKKTIREQVQHALIDEGYIVFSEPLATYRGEVKYNNPLFVIMKFCVVPNQMDLVFPGTKMIFNRGPLPREVLDEVIKNLLIKRGCYYFQEVDKVTSFDQIVYVDLIYDERKVELAFSPEDGNTLVDFSQLFGYNKGEELPLEIFDIPNLSKATLVEVLQKVPHPLTDELVENLHISDVKTVKELEQEISNTIHPNRQRMVLVDKIIDYIVKHSNIDIQNDLIEHFIQVVAYEHAWTYDEAKTDWDSYGDEVKNELIYTLKSQMVKLYLIRQAQMGHLNFIDDYLIKVQEQYDNHLHMIIEEDGEIDEHGLFLREQLDYAILFNFFVEQEIIIL